MTSTLMAAAVVAAAMVSAAPIGSAAQKDAKGKHPVTLQGCIVAGQDTGTFAMTGVQEIATADAVTVPPEAHGRRVVFWLDRQKETATDAGHKVEVKGRVTEVIEGEIEMKAGSSLSIRGLWSPVLQLLRVDPCKRQRRRDGLLLIGKTAPRVDTQLRQLSAPLGAEAL